MTGTAWKGWSGQGFTPADFIAYCSSLRWVAWRPTFVVVHNTEIPTLEQWTNTTGARYMPSMAHYFQYEAPRSDGGKGWSAGPHLFVDDRLIWVGTPLTVSGVHSPSWNPISFGVETVGDYNREPMNPDVFNNLASAIATLDDVLGLDPSGLRFHKEDPATSHRGCPGKNLKKLDLIALVRAKLSIRHGLEGEHLPDREVPVL